MVRRRPKRKENDASPEIDTGGSVAAASAEASTSHLVVPSTTEAATRESVVITSSITSAEESVAPKNPDVVPEEYMIMQNSGAASEDSAPPTIPQTVTEELDGSRVPEMDNMDKWIMPSVSQTLPEALKGSPQCSVESDSSLYLRIQVVPTYRVLASGLRLREAKAKLDKIKESGANLNLERLQKFQVQLQLGQLDLRYYLIYQRYSPRRNVLHRQLG